MSERLIEELKAISTPSFDSETNILKEEVERAVKRLKNNKSPGNDKITGEIIKCSRESMIQVIHRLRNIAWKEGKAPKEWTRSVLVTIHTKGSVFKYKNYRTNALTSHLGKVMMMILIERLRSQTEEHPVDEQAGFRKDRSTIQHILALRLILKKAWQKNKNT